MTTLTMKEWFAKAVELFGEDHNDWKFKCPACGHVQSVGDFKKFKDDGAGPNSAYQVCIGRYDGHMNVEMGSGQPCNYAGFGLFKLQKTQVIHPENNEPIPVFEFAEAT